MSYISSIRGIMTSRSIGGVGCRLPPSPARRTRARAGPGRSMARGEGRQAVSRMVRLGRVSIWTLTGIRTLPTFRRLLGSLTGL